MNIDISLNQGKKFNQYQNKIKESVDMQDLFTPIPNSSKKKTKRKSVETFQPRLKTVDVFKTTAQNLKEVGEINASESLETQQLVNQFNSLAGQYDTLAKQANASTTDILARNSDTNPYRGKNLGLNGTGALGWVTDLGTYKWWRSWDDVTASQGKNGCPVIEYNADGSPSGYIDVQDSTIYNTQGAIIDTKPSLIVGTPMVREQACGNEGKNVYVNKQVNNPTATYLGCYKDVPDTQAGGSDDQRAMIWNPSVIGYTTLDTCKKFAADNGYGYFGMQDGQPDGSAACLVSNDFTNTTKYGTPPVYTGIPVWSSGTNDSSVGAAPAPTGKVTFYDACGFSGKSASYGIGTYAFSNFPNLPAGTVVDATIANDTLSSVRVPAGLQVVLWAGYVGDSQGSLTLGPGDYSCLVDNGFNDVASTWVVSADPNTPAPVNTGNYVKMVNSQLIIYTSDGTAIVKFPPDEDSDCVNGGALNMYDGFSATYGGNCNSQGYNVPNNNVATTVQGYYNEFSLTNTMTDSYGQDSPWFLAHNINNNIFGDPAVGCPKGFDTTYKCGNKVMTAHMDYAENQTYLYDCTGVAATCQFTFVLQDDSNMCIYKNGSNSAVWCSMTNGAGFDVGCPWWVASEGKYKTNTLTNGQF